MYVFRNIFFFHEYILARIYRMCTKNLKAVKTILPELEINIFFPILTFVFKGKTRDLDLIGGNPIAADFLIGYCIHILDVR